MNLGKKNSFTYLTVLDFIHQLKGKLQHRAVYRCRTNIQIQIQVRVQEHKRIKQEQLPTGRKRDI